MNVDGSETTASQLDNRLIDTEMEEKQEVRSNAIHIEGVDDLNTADIEKLMVTFYNKPFQIEWIDDSSLNIVYDDPEDAFQSLVALTKPEEFEAPEPIAPEQLRNIKDHPDHPACELKGRFALSTDKKATGSRARSRYYLLHGEPSRKDDLVRFGTRRSKPMKYGFKGRDILQESRREERAGDLFPEKAPRISLDELDVDMDDLLPHKKPKRGGRGKRRGRNRRNRDAPDLFADKIGAVRKQNEDAPLHEDKKSNAPATTSIFQNMDY